MYMYVGMYVSWFHTGVFVREGKESIMRSTLFLEGHLVACSSSFSPSDVASGGFWHLNKTDLFRRGVSLRIYGVYVYMYVCMMYLLPDIHRAPCLLVCIEDNVIKYGSNKTYVLLICYHI